MTPAARMRLSEAVVAGNTLPVRVSGKLVKALHSSAGDAERIAHIEDAKRAALHILRKIQIAEAALKVHRIEGEQ